MHIDLLRLLRCPECGGDLTLDPPPPAGTSEVEEGALHCAGCGGSWPVVRGIPRLLPVSLAEEVQATGERFGFEWTTYTELADFYEDQFLAWIGHARPEDFRGSTVLDGGCGKGRHLALAHRFGARRAVGVDVGEAVEAARANTGGLDGVHVVQADLLNLPLDEAFDLIYSVGVLHHLPDPAAGFRSLARRLAPGGRIHIWVYGHEGNAWLRLLCDPVRKHVLRRLPPFLIRPLAWLVTLPLRLITGIYAFLQRHAPALHRHLFYRDYLTFLASLPLRSVYWIVFDQMVAPTTHYIRRGQVEEWLEEAGLEDRIVTPLRGMSWRGTGRRPEAAT